MLLLGDAIEIISNIYTLTSDVSKNGSILIDVPNVTSFYCGFKYHIDGSGGRLVTKIGDISNNIIIDISHNELLDSNLVIKYNDIIVKDVSLNSMFYDISDVPLDIKLLDGLLNVIINNIDISTNILVSEYQNNTFTIQGITDSSQNTIHLIKDIFFDPINVLEDDIFLKRGIYANRYFNVNYDDILNKPWMNIGFDDVYFGGGNVGIGTYVPLSGLDLWGNASIKGNLDISGHILPALNEVYDLGSNDYRWRDIYLSGNTIDLNGTKLSKHTNGNLMVHDTSGTMLGVTMDHIDLSGTIIRRHTDGSVVLDNGSGERVTGRFGDLDVSGNANVSGNISGVNITGTQLISNIASGTAPLTVTSTTLVTNLNADLLDGLDNTKFMRTDTNTSSTGTISSSSTITGTRLISNIASGTAPLTVTSTTIVTNLNADLLDNLDSTHYLNYNNLTNKPTIPAAQVNADWNAASGVAQILNKPTISTFNGGTITNRLTINYGDPTINFQDTDNDSAFLHCNSNILYVLRGGTNATTWTQVNGQWPWEFNLSNNNSKCGGSLNVIGGITSGAITAARVIPYSTSNNSSYYTAAIEVRELNQGGAQSGGWGEAPRIGFHWGGRVASQILMDTAGTITIVNNPGNAYEAFRAGTTFAHGTLYAYAGAVINMTSIGTFNTDFVGISGTTGNGGNYNLQLYILYNTFTGFHRSFTDDLLYNDEDPDIFKKTYMGRLVIASGEIATDTIVDKEKNEWTILRNKEGISVEDAVPIVQLTRQRKDKRVFGVLGLAERNNSRNERLIVNSVGEGAIWVVNTNGNIENGDYIQSSPELGYGERQDDDILHNYTAAKATIDCSFILDSPKYNCITLPNGLKAAFIACTYHCG